MTIPLKTWTRGSRITAADLNRMTEAIRRATPVAGRGISVSQGLGGSVISLSGSAGAGGGAANDGEDYPFKIARVNSGTVERPVWHTLVYVPDRAVSCRYPLYKDMAQYDSTNRPGWYEFSHNDGVGVVCLQVKVIRHNAWGYSPVRCYFKVGPNQQPADNWPVQELPVNYRWHVIPLGVVSSDGSVYNLVRSEVYVNADFILDVPGGGGGSAVDVTQGTGTSIGNGIVTYGGTRSDGVVSLVVKGGVVVSAIYMDENGTVALADWLAGSEEVTGLGANVNTANFADECLGDGLTPDDVPTPNVAAPSCHKHTLSQLVGPTGEELTGDDVASFFSNVGMWDSLGETGPSGQPPSEESILTVGDIEDDSSYLKPDGAVPDAGDISTDLLVLSGHVHPLNVADTIMATGPTGETPTPPPADNYVMPVGVGATGPSGDVDDPFLAEFGSQPFYARVDHVHPICADMGPTGLVTTGDVGPSGGMAMPDSVTGDFGPTGAPTGVVLDQHTWTPGSQGYVESYCTRVVMVVGAAATTRYAIFRRRAISRTGATVWVGPEYVGFRMLATTN